MIEDIGRRKLLRGLLFRRTSAARSWPSWDVRSGKWVLTVITYTGFLLKISWREDLKKGFWDLLQVSHWLIDGPFLAQRRDWNLSYRGSSNQRIIDVTASLEERRICILELEDRLTG